MPQSITTFHTERYQFCLPFHHWHLQCCAIASRTAYSQCVTIYLSSADVGVCGLVCVVVTRFDCIDRCVMLYKCGIKYAVRNARVERNWSTRLQIKSILSCQTQYNDVNCVRVKRVSLSVALLIAFFCLHFVFTFDFVTRTRCQFKSHRRLQFQFDKFPKRIEVWINNKRWDAERQRGDRGDNETMRRNYVALIRSKLHRIHICVCVLWKRVETCKHTHSFTAHNLMCTCAIDAHKRNRN